MTPTGSPRFPINSGVFSRIYRWPDKTVSFAYHTPSRSASTLEGDSAEVWWRLFQSRGATDTALDDMLNGAFGADGPRQGPRHTRSLPAFPGGVQPDRGTQQRGPYLWPNGAGRRSTQHATPPRAVDRTTESGPLGLLLAHPVEVAPNRAATSLMLR